MESSYRADLIMRELFLLNKLKKKSGAEQPVFEYLVNRVRNSKYNFEVQTISRGSYNLIVNPIQKPKMVLATHIDVVDEDDDIIVRENKITAFGISDPLAQVETLLLLLDQGIPNGVSIAFFVDEEDWGSGSQTYLAEYKPQSAIILEPTNLEVMIESIGALGLTIHLKLSEEYHGGVPIGLKNLKKLTMIMERISNILSMRGIIVNPLIIDCGNKQKFTTLSECHMILELIFDMEVYSVGLNRMLSELDEIFKKENIGWHVDYISPPFKAEEKYANEIKSILGSSKYGKYISWSDANNFFKYGVEKVIVFGPGDPTLAHTKDEFIDVNDVILATKMLRKVLDQIDNLVV